ncbi:host cell division inhibitor Icd-like protein [Erwinia aphidicola]|uniref:host cell division inhibitor Icd-like protein n=2 Tax=Erwinia aphidicola TaxID=68334 RepID=UPI0030D03839
MLLCVRHLVSMILVLAKPSSATNTYWASIHNVTKACTMEYSHSTQTRPEKTYLWRFLALNRSDMGAKPCRISVEAPTEHDARRVLAPFFILSLSARLSAQGVCNA